MLRCDQRRRTWWSRGRLKRSIDINRVARLPPAATPDPRRLSHSRVTMSGPRFPPELFDHTVDFLHDQPKTLKQCCLVSKPWVPRTRKHLFSYIAFHSPDDFDVWKNTFPDPASSPARYTRFLSVCLMENVGGLVLDSSGWIRAFSKVVRLEVPSSMLNLYLRLPIDSHWRSNLFV